MQGAKVVARQMETNIASTRSTDRDGRFRFPYLKVGPYEITVAHQGFEESMRPVTLTVGAAFELPFTLVIGAMETKVTVSDEAPVLEGDRSQIAGAISQTEVQNLPLNGRNYFDLALFVPGVSPTNTAANQLFAETSAVPGQGISIGSQRNFSNSFIIDGVSANDDAAGVAGTFVGLDVVQEFQVVTSGGQAELGRALGGYVNVVTKSGGNTYAWRRLWILPQQPLQRGQRSFQHRSAAYPGAVRRQYFRTGGARQDLLFREFRRPRSEPVGPCRPSRPRRWRQSMRGSPPSATPAR